MRKQINLIIIIVIIVLMVILFPKPKTHSYFKTESNLKEVEITGAVNNPGVYLVPDGINLSYLINLSGGLRKDADITDLNLGIILSTNKYEIPIYQKFNEEIIVKKINLNQAKFSDLILIPNITEDRATNILIFRNENGSFKSIDELLLVKGIGPATFEKIKMYFTI